MFITTKKKKFDILYVQHKKLTTASTFMYAAKDVSTNGDKNSRPTFTL